MHAAALHELHLPPPPLHHHRANHHQSTQLMSNAHHSPDPSPASQRVAQPQSTSLKDLEVVVGIPALSVSGSTLILGNSHTSSTRSWTPLKVVGDGSFGTVWLCDWHSILPPNTPLSPMQCGAGARPEWSGKRLVAVKRMKKKWEGGWDECRKLKELESLRAIPSHPNIIPLYDSFLLPASKELYFVFESMEGNLYQLIKSRKSRPLAGGLVSSIYRQVVCGLHHIHCSGYFHRDMKPENLLVTTTGLADYDPTSPIAPPGSPPEKDVVVIIKLADFGLARETRSKPPYTEYVSTRWYRAPEVLLRSRDYSNPVDMWALGTILAELINLKPLFPGAGEIDQVARICQLLGDPCHDYGLNDRGRLIGGGQWQRGVKLAKQVGFTFPKLVPARFRSQFDASIPPSLIDCIEDLLKYEPEARLTSKQCMEHPYLLETTPRSPQPQPSSLQVAANVTPPRPPRLTPAYVDGLPSVPPRSIPPSHSESPANARPAFNNNISVAELRPSSETQPTHRTPFFPQPEDPRPPAFIDQLRHLELPTDDLSSYGGRSTPSPVPSSIYSSFATDAMLRQQTQSPENWSMQVEPLDPEAHDSPMDVPQSPIVHSLPPDDDPGDDYAMDSVDFAQEIATPISPQNKFGKLGALGGFGKKHTKWGLSSVFGHGSEKHQPPPSLPPVDELNVSSSRSTPSLKRTQSNSTSDSRSPSPPPPAPDPKKLKKVQERLARDAEKARRAEAEKEQRERARAVMQKRNQIIKQNKEGTDFDWQSTNSSMLAAAKVRDREAKGKQREADVGPRAIERQQLPEENPEDWVSNRSKARRRDLDDDHSMSSSDVHSISRMSMISFASVDSDPGPTRTFRHRPAHANNVYGLPRAPSISSLRTSSGRGFSPSARSSNSFDRQFVREFSERAILEPTGTGSPQMGDLSLSPTQSWSPVDQAFHQATSPPVGSLASRRMQDPRYVTLPSINVLQPQQQESQLVHYEPGSGSSQPSSPYPVPFPNSAVNPMFQVPPFPSPPLLPTHHPSSQQGSLPPCSELLSVADQQQQPSSFEHPESQ